MHRRAMGAPGSEAIFHEDPRRLLITLTLVGQVIAVAVLHAPSAVGAMADGTLRASVAAAFDTQQHSISKRCRRRRCGRVANRYLQ